jgi:hypothetical protein
MITSFIRGRNTRAGVFEPLGKVFEGTFHFGAACHIDIYRWLPEGLHHRPNAHTPANAAVRDREASEGFDGLQSFLPQLSQSFRLLDAPMGFSSAFEVEIFARLAPQCFKVPDERLRPVHQDLLDRRHFGPILIGIRLRLTGPTAVTDLAVDAARVLWIGLQRFCTTPDSKETKDRLCQHFRTVAIGQWPELRGGDGSDSM